MAARWTDALITINAEDYAVASHFKLRGGGKAYMMHGVGVQREKYILEDFEQSEYRKGFGLSDKDFVILVLAEINKNKNHIQLLKALKLLKDRYPNIKSVFAGSGPLTEEIKNTLKEFELLDRVIMLGWRNDVKELINMSDVVGLFSKREGLPKCLLEAMMCGKCVIATNARGSRELIEEGVNGVIFEVGDVEGTVKSIEKIYASYQLYMASKEKVIEMTNKYLLESVLAELSLVYKELYKEKMLVDYKNIVTRK
ncbi:capsular polysaccharide biosynthesis protein [Elysia marginata]|uniref:Capsular polysaccharide biosynthesis protein n=1 Tax=Elysia marginata TaxID=1093978 RepID=A0AAV4GZJ1_9GAST|nr:capsular polysaccharide biosynthesis protein [Elysia marginata]